MFDINKFTEYERYFFESHAESFELLPGMGKVMVSAPHSVEQTRFGKSKYAEPQTGALAKLLHDCTGCPVIYKTKNCGDDANFDKFSDYKKALALYVKENDIRFLLDLHQLSANREVKVNFGTANMKNIKDPELLKIATKAFERTSLGSPVIDVPFSAAYPYTVSSYVSDICDISCLQIELRSDVLRTGTAQFAAREVFDALVEIIKNSEENFL